MYDNRTFLRETQGTTQVGLPGASYFHPVLLWTWVLHVPKLDIPARAEQTHLSEADSQ